MKRIRFESIGEVDPSELEWLKDKDNFEPTDLEEEYLNFKKLLQTA